MESTLSQHLSLNCQEQSRNSARVMNAESDKTVSQWQVLKYTLNLYRRFSDGSEVLNQHEKASKDPEQGRESNIHCCSPRTFSMFLDETFNLYFEEDHKTNDHGS